MTELLDKTYDGLDLPDEATRIALKCKTCGGTTLVENTSVPRSMGADLYRTPDGYIVDLMTYHDDTFWEAESGHIWGCATCVAESEDIFAIFEASDIE